MVDRTKFKSINLDAQTMDSLDYLAFISSERKTVILRRVLRMMRKVANNYMQGTEISVRIEDNRIIIEFFGESRTCFVVEKVKGESAKDVVYVCTKCNKLFKNCDCEKVIKIKGEL